MADWYSKWVFLRLNHFCVKFSHLSVLFFLLISFNAYAQVNTDTIPYTEGREFMLPFELMDDEAMRMYMAADKAYKEEDLFTALKYINTAIKINHKVPEYFILKSRIEQGSNKHKKALKSVNQAVKLAPNSAATLYARAVCKYTAEDFMGAAQDYTRVISIDPGNHMSFYGRGVAKSQLQEFSSAKEDFDVAIMLKPTLARAYLARGIAKLRLQQHKDAMYDLSSYTIAVPGSAEGFYYLGLARIGAGDIVGGCGDLTKAKLMGYKKAEAEASKYCIR
jgi:tetratricopeptide (TPR) repeat protein